MSGKHAGAQDCGYKENLTPATGRHKAAEATPERQPVPIAERGAWFDSWLTATELKGLRDNQQKRAA